MASALRVPRLSALGSTLGRRSIRGATGSSNRLRRVDRGLHLVSGDGLTGFLSLQPGLHRVLGEEPPASNENALRHVLSSRELVADGSGLQTQCLGELLNRI